MFPRNILLHNHGIMSAFGKFKTDTILLVTIDTLLTRSLPMISPLSFIPFLFLFFGSRVTQCIRCLLFSVSTSSETRPYPLLFCRMSAIGVWLLIWFRLCCFPFGGGGRATTQAVLSLPACQAARMSVGPSLVLSTRVTRLGRCLLDFSILKIWFPTISTN